MTDANWLNYNPQDNEIWRYLSAAAGVIYFRRYTIYICIALAQYTTKNGYDKDHI